MRPSAIPPLFLLLLSACGEDPKPDDTDTTVPQETGPDSWAEFVDADGDGITEADGDCDDQDPLVFPGNTEDCNGADDNCNDMIDEGWPDTDGDATADCLDTEECDGVDNDGDGRVDEDFADTDGDGIADCIQDEVCDGLDNNGDGSIDEGFDTDGDGYTTCGSDELLADCDDSDAAIHPDATEVEGDAIDNDCDGMADEGVWAPGDLLINEIMANPQAVADPRGEWFEVLNLADEARHLNGLILVAGSGAQEHVVQSEEPLILEPGGYFVFGNNGDFDTNGGVFVDYAYSGLTLGNESDELSLHTPEITIESRSWDDGDTMPDTAGASMSLDSLALERGEYDAANWCEAQHVWELRSDYGSPGEPNAFCPNFDHDGDGYASGDGDCDDEDASIFPSAEDFWYDGIDQNCDGASDYDADADGFDSDLFGGTDCDDEDDEINPDATEICDELDIDEDCTGTADNDDAGATGTTTWYMDLDADGYGAGTGTDYCDPPPPTSLIDGDCDDRDATSYPGATEIWYDGVDQNCDGANDYDADADGFDSDLYGGDDCDDADASLYPTDWYPDADGDGYGDDTASPTTACGQPSGYLADNTDCDDANAAIHLCQSSWEIASAATSNWSNSGYYRGNSYQAVADNTLVSFEQYMYLASACTIDFYVHEQGSSGIWTIVWYDSISASAGTGYISSGTIDLAVTNGNKYMLGVGYTCTATTYGASGSWSGYDTGIGTFRNPHFSSGYTGYSASFVPGSTGGSTTAYTQIVTLDTMI